MNIEAAREWLARGDDSIDDEVTAAAISVVLARLAELEAGEVTTEWAVRWPADATHGPDLEHDDPYERHHNRAAAERVVRAYRLQGATLVQQEVRTWRGPWTEVTS